MQRVQKRATGAIAKYEVHYQVVTDTLMHMDCIYKYFTSIKLFKVLNEGQHSYFLDRVSEYVMRKCIMIMPADLR